MRANRKVDSRRRLLTVYIDYDNGVYGVLKVCPPPPPHNLKMKSP